MKYRFNIKNMIANEFYVPYFNGRTFLKMPFKQAMKMKLGEKFGGIGEHSFANDFSVPLPLITLLS